MAEVQQLNEIALKVGRLEVLQEANTKAVADMAGSVNRLVDKLDQSDNIAREADQRARSAHHRLDSIEAARARTVTTTVSLCGLIATIVTLALKFIGG